MACKDLFIKFGYSYPLICTISTLRGLKFSNCIILNTYKHTRLRLVENTNKTKLCWYF